MRTPVSLIVAAVAAMALTGCAEEKTPESQPPPASAGTTPTATAAPTKADTARDVCALLTVGEVSDLIGQTAAVDTDKKPVAGRDCTWLGKQPALHQVYLQVFTGASYYGPTRWGGSPEPVAGLGDESFLIKKSPLGATVGFRDGDNVVFLNYQILLNRDPNPGAASDKMVALAKAVKERM